MSILKSALNEDLSTHDKLRDRVKLLELLLVITLGIAVLATACAFSTWSRLHNVEDVLAKMPGGIVVIDWDNFSNGADYKDESARAEAALSLGTHIKNLTNAENFLVLDASQVISAPDYMIIDTPHPSQLKQNVDNSVTGGVADKPEQEQEEAVLVSD